jgi:predicted enzyme related to lactoylglutathione lyase
MSYEPGNIVHLEIPAPDIAAAKAFYGRVFGWTFQTLHERYEFFDAGNLAGAFDADKKPSREGTVIAVMAADVATKLRDAEAAGGTILQEATVIPGGMGSYGYFADPAGNRIGVWMPASDPSA